MHASSINKHTHTHNLTTCAKMLKRCSNSICRKLGISQNGVFFNLINKFFVALFTCIFAIGGGAVGAVAGAMKGQTTETGFSRGLCVGAVAGAVTGVQLMELVVNGEPFSKVALICSLVNGNVFREWVSPAVLAAYEWQISGMDSMAEFSDIFDHVTLRGLPQNSINELPTYTMPISSQTSCAICLLDMKNGQGLRWLPCEHIFHLNCIDEWLRCQPSCPMCRYEINN